VAENNAPARALYLATGWRESGRRRGYYQTPDGARIDALLMARALAPPAS
jgi:ribosomal-protein-alanine N-acetyltransferase